ncbi:MAG TPA: GspH/FimT family pseudopilin [Candidatus Eisenbacteria bacterium]|nr:GspH/FimT family pseudopilin [Candidatus Eisenbacteria bacterium]
MRKGSRQSGFTMTEVMVVTMIAGLSLAAGVPAFARFTQTARLDGAARQFAAHLRLARQQAVAESTPYLFLWSNSTWYYLIKDNDQSGYYSGGDTYVGPYWLPSGIYPQNATGFTNPYLALNPNGSCNQSGSFDLVNERGMTITVTLLGPTGQVQISKATRHYEAEQAS